MANTVSTLAYANTFGQWMVVTNALGIENNNLAANDYVKSSGTLYLNETTKNSLQANGTVVIQKQLLVQGVGSSASIDNNLSVSGQVYFTNTTLGLTNSGQANINGLLLAQGSGTGLYVANNAIVNGNAVIQYTTRTNYLQANSTVNTATASVTGTTWTNDLIANSKIMGSVASISGPIFVDTVQANTSVLTSSIQANSTINTASLSVTGPTYTNVLQANSTINTATASVTGTTWSNVLRANTSANTPVMNVTTRVDATQAAGIFNTLQTISDLSVGGNFVINGSTVYNTNQFTINAGSATGLTSYFGVNRGTYGANAAIRWNEGVTSGYWDVLNVTGSTYYRMLTDDYPGTYATAGYEYSNSAYARANTSLNTVNGSTGTASPSSGAMTLTATNGMSVTASGNTLTINTPQDLRTSATPQFNNITLRDTSTGNPLALPITYGGTGATDKTSALTNLLPTGGTSGYVLATGGSGSYYWAAGGTGGGGGTTPGTTIQSNRLSYTATSGQTNFTAPVYLPGASQTRVYINGVRQFASEYTESTVSLTNVKITGTAGQFSCDTATLITGQAIVVTGTITNGSITNYISGKTYYIIGSPTSTSFVLSETVGGSAITTTDSGGLGSGATYTTNYAIALSTGATTGDAVLIEVDGYILNPYYANNIAFTINSNISPTANSIQLAIDGLTTKLVSNYANTTSGYGGYSNPTWITSLDAAKISTGTLPTSVLPTLPSSVFPASGVTSGTYGGGVTSSSSQLPVITVDSTGRVTSAANVTVTSTSVYANTGQLTANAATGVVAVGLATSGVIAGNYGSGTTTPIITIDAYGRITGATTTLITGGSAGIGATSYVRTPFTATAGQTSFTVSYTVGYVQVYVNGVLLSASDYTSSSGTSIVMGSALRAGDLVDIFAYTVTLVNNVSPSYTGGQGGLAGQILYQSAANTTSNTDVGTTGQLLLSGGTGKPTWSSNVQVTSIGVGTAASGTTGEIRATNNITAYYSDDRLKTKLGTIDNALDKLCSLTGFYYEANETAQALGYGVRKEVGVSAQDVQKVLPEIVTAAPIDDKYLTIYYDKLIPLVIEAIKELKQEVDALKGNIK